MRLTVRIIQIFVGILFILSGLVKANDPMGLSFKMQEFFEIWNGDLNAGSFFAKNILISLFDFFHAHAVFLSVTMITLEIMAGVALLLGWKRKLVLWTLLILMIFFTFLTGFAYLSLNPDGSPRFTNCGCFGDCLPLEPKVSFIKDVVLLVLLMLLMAGRKFLFAAANQLVRMLVLTGSLLFCLLFQWYVLNYLPVVDCLPFKKGNVLPEKMKAPPGSIPSKYESRMVYKNMKTGEAREMSMEEFNTSKIWEDTSWKWESTITKLVQKGTDIPEIQGFSLFGKETMDSTSGSMIKPDSTNYILTLPKAILGFGMEDAGDGWLDDLNTLITASRKSKVPVYFTSNNPVYFEDQFRKKGIGLQVFSTDFTVIRTAARANPTFYYLENGKVIEKYSYRQLDELKERLMHP